MAFSLSYPVHPVHRCGFGLLSCPATWQGWARAEGWNLNIDRQDTQDGLLCGLSCPSCLSCPFLSILSIVSIDVGLVSCPVQPRDRDGHGRRN